MEQKGCHIHWAGGRGEVGSAGGIVVKMRWQGLSRDSGSGMEKQDGQEKYFKGKMSRTSSLTGFKGSTRNTLAELIPRFLSCNLGGPKYQETIVKGKL